MHHKLGSWMLAAAIAACGGNPPATGDDAPPDDAAPAPLPPTRAQLVAGGGRIHAGTLTLDVQLGEPGFAVAAGAATLGNAPVIGGAR
ncbi:MAG: hypothetical protein KF773_28610 [Deltaproteobacteria bacterium]|nr:hypothetical protein [Deltaproteobacteria bacterium]